MIRMEKQTVEITQFEPRYQKQVEDLVLPIQVEEFGVPITLAEQPELVDINGVFQAGNGNFWVALHGDRVVGTIGVVDIGNDEMALKKMFVDRDFRGQVHGISALLMQSAKEWCTSHGVNRIYLGTTAQMKAAHRFYEKNGFVELQESELPPAFPIVHVDSKFYVCELALG